MLRLVQRSWINVLLVTTKPDRHDWLMFSMALPLKIPCVTMAKTWRAPC